MGIHVQTTKEPETEHPTTTAAVAPANGTQADSAPAAPSGSTAPTANEVQSSVAVTANPESAEIYLDGSFVGNAPATLKLTPGKHTILVVQNGYKDWSRETR